MLFLRSTILSSMLLLPALHSFAQTYPDATMRILDSIATQDVPKGAPGIATAIIENGVLTYQKSVGFADFNDSSTISPDTRFNVASNGKQFTALAVLTLIEKGKIKLSDNISTYLPDLFSGVDKKITIRQLLTHTSGIRDVYDLWSLQGLTWWEQSFSNTDVLDLISRQSDLNFIPGSQYLYSNTNYILLALIIEKVSNESFVSYTSKMFKLLGMNATSFEDKSDKIAGQIARAYFNFNTWTTFRWIWNVCGDGNLFSTLNDQIRWEKIVQGKIQTSISPAIIKKSQQPVEGTLIKGYGYGLENGNYRGMPYRFHEGATGAWKATVLRFPSKAVSIICLTNSGKTIPSMQSRQMADVLFQNGEDSERLVTRPTRVGKLVPDKEIPGFYLTSDGFLFQLELVDNKMFLKRNGRNDVELEREAANIFHQVFDTAFKQEFILNKKGEMELTAYYTSHAPYTLIRANSNWNGFVSSSINGEYFNDETNTTLSITHSKDKNYKVKIASQDTTSGHLIAPNKLLVDNYRITISNETRNGTILKLDGARIRNVKFQRRQPDKLK